MGNLYFIRLLMYLLMLLESVSPSEPFPANLANIRFLAGMHSQMRSQPILELEASAALLARIPLPDVPFVTMLRQSNPIIERFAANLAHMIGGRIDMHGRTVAIQGASVGGGVSAPRMRTLKQLYQRMRSHMNGQRISTNKRFIALLAFERTIFGVTHSVHHHISFRAERLITRITLVRASMLQRVTIKRFCGGVGPVAQIATVDFQFVVEALVEKETIRCDEQFAALATDMATLEVNVLGVVVS